MFYAFIRPVARFIVWLLNGHLHVYNKELIPKGNYILIAPHRTWWEPVLFALAASPTKFMFMAKEELFKNAILRFILTHANAFPVDRKNPGPSAIKIPVRGLKDSDKSLIMFPSGTRHSEELKSGAIVIAKLAKKPLVPVVYQGPLTFGGLLKRQPLKVSFGNPIEFDLKKRITPEFSAEVFNLMESSWDKIDQQLDPNFKYIPK